MSRKAGWLGLRNIAGYRCHFAPGPCSLPISAEQRGDPNEGAPWWFRDTPPVGRLVAIFVRLHQDVPISITSDRIVPCFEQDGRVVD